MQTVPLIRIWEREITGLSLWQGWFDGLLDDTFLHLLKSQLLLLLCHWKKKSRKNPYPHKWIVLPFKEGFLANQSNESKYVNIINILLQKLHTETRMCMWKYVGTIIHSHSKFVRVCLFMCLCVSHVLSQVKTFNHSSVRVLAQPWTSRTHRVNPWPWFVTQMHICWTYTCANTHIYVHIFTRISMDTYTYNQTAMQ